MKLTESVGRRSPFWSRILGLLISFAIVAVLVFGGVKNLMGELSAVHEALSASQSEVAVTQHKLSTAKSELATSKHALDIANDRLERRGYVLQSSLHYLEEAKDKIQALTDERDDLKRGLSEAANALGQSDQRFMAADYARRSAENALERYLHQPKLSVIVTTERQFTMSQRERFAASQVRMFMESDAGTMFYDGREALHEIEKHMTYAERTQVVMTQTAPGDDVLACLNEGCAVILGAQYRAARMEAYSYQSQYRASETLLWME